MSSPSRCFHLISVTNIEAEKVPFAYIEYDGHDDALNVSRWAGVTGAIRWCCGTPSNIPNASFSLLLRRVTRRQSTWHRVTESRRSSPSITAPPCRRERVRRDDPVERHAEPPHPVGFVLGGGGSLGRSPGRHARGADGPAGDTGPRHRYVRGVAQRRRQSRSTRPERPTDSTRGHGCTEHQIFPGGLLSQARTLQHSKTHLFPDSGLAAVIADFLGATTTSMTSCFPSLRSRWRSLPPLPM